MTKILLYLFSLLCIPVIGFSQGSFAPAVGYTGTTAISAESADIVSWATGIELARGWVNISNKSYTYSGSNKATYGVASVSLLKADNNVVSLGDSGVATLTFDRPIVNGSGADFTIFENGFFLTSPNAFLELAFVEVSSDGIHFIRFPAVSEVPVTAQVGSFASIDATYLNNFAGKYTATYGTPFDLEDLKDSPNLDINNIRLVRLVDVIGNIDPSKPLSRDSKNNIVNDPFPTPFNSSGFDLDAIGVIHSGNPYSISNFSDLTLESNTYWNPGKSKVFTSGAVTFPYNYSTYAWDGFVYSNQTDITTGTYENQYSAITGGGIDGAGTNYAVAYQSMDYTTFLPVPNSITFTDQLPHALSGFYVTNSTYTYYTMKNGDTYSKIFGGTTGTDPDWLNLEVWGEKEDGTLTETLNFYLADFRFADNTKDYIVNDWRWVDLTKLGTIKKLLFTLKSSDAGTYGMNTPAYFCLDNLVVIPNTGTATDVKLTDASNVKIYPNPFVSNVTIECQANDIIRLYNPIGQKILEQRATSATVQLSTNNLKPGYYLLQIENIQGTKTQKIIKQ